ncbi:hypothetical protein BUALT_Bualt02G0000900 [Buddleja alternifolia]|uniref:Gnk2-homologous domain-containing protein n=1 Tax=Buddleja alternifolia TaxID=168488 RepID=A0AAV6Y7F1_9LAMI|nr:hypothetical protein BUALT_Bualt02G0000900 [Buddleja alternifolia]
MFFNHPTMNIFCNFLFVFFLYISTAQSAGPTYHICNTNSQTNHSNQTSKNTDILLSQLVQGTIQHGFVATSYGEGVDEIYGLSQCRGDVSKNDCSICIKDAAKEILKLCPNQSDARVWYDYCFLRYNKVRFFGQVDTSGAYLINVQNVTGVDNFSEKRGSLINQISSEAVKPPNRLGKEKSKISPFLTLYGLVQCTRDLSETNCAQCLAVAIRNVPGVCGNRRGCQVLYSSCYVRYELYPFFFPLDSKESLDHNSADDKSFMVFKP